MRIYLDYIHSISRPRRSIARRRSAGGMTVVELLLASLMMLIAVSIAGNGVINLLRNNYKANADSELRNSMVRTLDFIRGELKQASIVIDTPSKINKNDIPSTGVPILAFQIADPNNSSQTIPEQIVYYVQKSENPWLGPQVLWRRGPRLDANGNYENPEDPDTWITTAVTDLVVGEDSNANRDCDPFREGTLSGWTRFPEQNSDLRGMYACVRQGQVLLVANAELQMTTNETSSYSISTKMSTRSSDSPFFLSRSTDGPTLNDPALINGEKSRIILTGPSDVTTKVISDSRDCSGGASCRVETVEPGALSDVQYNISYEPVTIFGSANSDVIVYAGGMTSLVGNRAGRQSVMFYTADSPSLPADFSRSLNANEILVVMTNLRNQKSYSILVTITPRSST